MKQAISVANMVLLNENEQVLLLRRSSFLRKALKWGLPGGLIDADENPNEAASRELEEETGISRNTLIIEKIAQFVLRLPDEDIRMYTVRARSNTTNPAITLSEEHVDYGWFDVNDIGTLPDVISGLPTIIAGTIGKSLPIIDSTLSSQMTVNKII